MMARTRLSSFLLAVSLFLRLETCNGTNDNIHTSLGVHREHNGRILASEDTNPGEFPFFTQWGGCGATLIWEDILLTSASCRVVDNESVLVGAHMSNQEQDDSVRRSVVSRHVHPEFDPNSLVGNYMVLKLDEKVDTLPTVWINPTVEIPEDPEMYVVGFGFTASLVQVNEIYSRTFHHTILDTTELLQHGNNDSPSSRMKGSTLQKAQMSIVNYMECNASDQYAGFIHKESMICARDDNAACLGDNGGPLCVMMNGECLQIGIISFGESCAMGHRPTVFSGISDEYGWIEKMVCALSDNPPSECQTVVEISEPLSESSFLGRSESNNSKTLDSPNETSIEKSGMRSDASSSPSISRPSPVNSTAPIGSPTMQDEDYQIENKTTHGFQEKRKLKELRYVMPMDFFQVPDEETKDVGPDGIHLFFWPNGSPNEKLGRCEGDCGTDDDCEEGLFCFKKDLTTTSLPGCEGFDLSRTNFCTDKIEDSVNEDSRGIIANKLSEESLAEDAGLPLLLTRNADTSPLRSNEKLGQCEGDCSSDEDCAEGLYCFFKNPDVKSVPGCSGFDDSRTDFCTNVRPGIAGPMAAEDTSEAPLLFAYEENPPAFENLPLQMCQGDCDSDSDCAEGLLCYTRPQNQITIPGCSGVTITRTDFCIDPSFLFLDGRSDQNVAAVSVPTGQPTDTMTEIPTQLFFVETSPTTERDQFPRPPTIAPTGSKPLVSLTSNPTIEQLEAPSPSSNALTETTPLFADSLSNTPSPTIATPPPTAMPVFSDPSIANGLAPESLVLITLAIYFDPWPEELSWNITRESDETQVIAKVAKNFYKKPRDHTFEFILLQPDESYVLNIADVGGDGIAGIGTLFELFLTDHPDISLTEGDGVFQHRMRRVFSVPAINDIPSSAPISPTISPAPSISLAPNIPLVMVYLVIIFDNWHQETSWEITDATNPDFVLAAAPFDTYRSGNSITEEIPLRPDRDYKFTIKDFFEDGIKDGEYVLMTDDGTVLAEGNGDFGASREHTFSLPFPEF